MDIRYNPRDWYWQIGDDASAVYASKIAAFVSNDEGSFVAWRQEAGHLVSRAANMDELVYVLRAAGVPPYHSVTPYRIVRRLEAAGVAAQAIAVLEAPENAVLRWRFTTLAGVPADDVDARALIIAAGADPDEILAPE